MFLFRITENDIQPSLSDGVLGTALVRNRMPGGEGGASVRQLNYLTDHLPDFHLYCFFTAVFNMARKDKPDLLLNS